MDLSNAIENFCNKELDLFYKGAKGAPTMKKHLSGPHSKQFNRIITTSIDQQFLELLQGCKPGYAKLMLAKCPIQHKEYFHQKAADNNLKVTFLKKIKGSNIIDVTFE